MHPILFALYSNEMITTHYLRRGMGWTVCVLCVCVLWDGGGGNGRLWLYYIATADDDIYTLALNLMRLYGKWLLCQVFSMSMKMQ